MHLSAAFPVAALLVAAAPGQSLSILVAEGDVIPGVGTVTRVDGVTIANDGSTLIEVDTDHPDTDADSVMLRDGVPFLRENQPLAAPAGATLGSFDGASITPAGGQAIFNLFLSGAVSTNDNSGIYIGDSLLLREGDLSTAPEFSAGTIYTGFFDVRYTRAAEQALVIASVDDPAIASTTDRALVLLTFNFNTVTWEQTVLAKEGDVPTGQTEPIADFETGAEEVAMNGSGEVIYSVDLAGDTAVDRAVYLNDTLLMQEGSPSPVAGRNWGSLTSVEVDVNSSGSWVAKANLDNTDTATDDVIVRDGAIFRRAGDTLPAIGPHSLTDFGSSVGVWVTDAGDVVWFGDWDDPDTSRDEGLFINDQLVLQEGVTVVDGETIIDLSDITEQVHVSPSGRFILIEGEYSDGSDLDAVILIETGFGTSYCDANPNSTGVTGVVRATGSGAAAANNLTIVASSLPLNQFGLTLVSPASAFVPTAGGMSNGNLCLGGPIGRINVPLSSGAGGTFGTAIDLAAIPQGNGSVPAIPGDTWYFQVWHRDLVGLGSNFTNAVAVSFE